MTKLSPKAKPFKSVSGYWQNYAARMRAQCQNTFAGWRAERAFYAANASAYKKWLGDKNGWTDQEVNDRIQWQRQRMSVDVIYTRERELIAA